MGSIHSSTGAFAAAFIAFGLSAGSVWATPQADDFGTIAEPVVQPIRGAEGMRLDAALARLARDPRNVEALLDAGRASLTIGDVDAAIGFYQRADSLSPGNSKVKAGLAGAYVRREDPASAIPLFDEAEKGGPIDPMLVADRGLAFDLVGDNTTAQRYYRESLIAIRNDETSRRLALSQAIAGDRRGMELSLAPLLQKQDKAAWRTRAFALAILGSPDEAESIARSTMPADLANGVSAYLRYMPRLTRAQQAAAANLGHFPRAAEIGQDDLRLAQYARTRPIQPTVLAAAAAPAVASSTGKPGSRSRREERSSKKLPALAAATPVAARPAATPPPEPQPAREPVRIAIATPAPPPVSVAPAPPPAPAPVLVAPPPPPAAAVAPPGPTFSTFDLKQVPVAAATTQAPAPAPPPVSSPPPPPPAKPRTLADVFADLTPPSRVAEPETGAVDVRRIAAARPAASKDKGAKDAKETKPIAPSHPSRIWVQLATGRNKAALGYDWRKLVRENPEVLRNRKGHTSAWGQTNRLITGPFESEAAASAFLTQLRKAGVSGAFLWNSPAGQVVDALSGR